MKSKQVSLICSAMLLALLVGVGAFAQGVTIYNNIPKPLPGNLGSVGYEASSASEWGDRVAFAGVARNARSVTLTMSSWGCEAGHWFSHDCLTTPGSSFSHPITLNIYSVGAGNQVGTLLGSVTKTFVIPFRPSTDIAHCPDGETWFDAKSNTCFHGIATNITFNLAPLSLVLPNQVIFGVAYNTTHFGYHPIGESAACFVSSGGCGYDSLNVAGDDLAVSLSVGTNPAPNDAYFNTLFGPNYCDGGTGGVGVFRLDAGCWAGFKPSIRFRATRRSCKEDLEKKEEAFGQQQEADRKAFNSQPHTKAQEKAFKAKQEADRDAFEKQLNADKKRCDEDDRDDNDDIGRDDG